MNLPCVLKFNRMTVFMVLYVLVFSGIASADRQWRGVWIGSDQVSKPNSWYCFRNDIELSKSPKTAVANIACDSKYWLWINDEMVVFEGQLKRGPTPKDTYYDEIDLTGHLKKGKNAIAVLVWYWGKHGFAHNSSGKAGLIFDADIDGKSVVSDSSWKVKLHPAYSSTAKPHPNWRLAEPNIKFDAQNDIADWYKSNYNYSGWSESVEFGKPPVAPWNRLEKRQILQWKNTGIIDYKEVTEKNNDDGTKTVIGVLPYNCQVTPYLKIDAPASMTVNMQGDNYNNMPNGPTVRAEYITRRGIQEYESLGWMNGHEIQYTMPKEVKVLEVKYRETGYNADFVGTFDCDDERLNTLWEKAKRTLYVTMRDNYMDCPDRERAQWWGDAVNELGEAFYVFDAEKGPLLAKKGIYELARWQRPDKVLFSPVPAGIPEVSGVNANNGTWDRELPRQMLASVGWYGFWTYYWYTGDKQTIVDVYPHVRDYLSLWEIGKDGLVIHRAGDWDWTDWGHNKDVAVLENAWLYLALKAGVEMAKLSGDESDIAGYMAKMDSIEANFNETFWRGDRYHSPGYDGKTDDRANAMAVVAGLAKKEYYPLIQLVLANQYHASPYMEKYVMEALYLLDAPGQGVERTKKRFASMIDAPITTLYENFGDGKDREGNGTYNHAWSGGALTVLSQYAAGIAPTKPGFEEFAVLPQMGPLKRIRVVVPTKYGNIRLKLNNEKTLSMDLTVPKGTEAIIGVPKEINPANIRLNGKLVYKSGKAPTGSYVGEDDKWIKYSVKAGNWKIKANVNEKGKQNE